MFKVGEVTHYYYKLGVAIVALDASLAVGDEIKFVNNEADIFEQKVESIQFGHEKRDSANKGDVVGLKTNGLVKAGTKIYKKG